MIRYRAELIKDAKRDAVFDDGSIETIIERKGVRHFNTAKDRDEWAAFFQAPGARAVRILSDIDDGEPEPKT